MFKSLSYNPIVVIYGAKNEPVLSIDELYSKSANPPVTVGFIDDVIDVNFILPKSLPLKSTADGFCETLNSFSNTEMNISFSYIVLVERYLKVN